MALIAPLALFLVVGVCYLLFVWIQLLVGALRCSLGQLRTTSVTASARERESQILGAEVEFSPGFRKTHFSILGAFVLVYSLVAFVVWGDYYRTFKSILMVICGPFATAILDSTGEHWKTAWVFFPFCAAFVLWGIFCQFVRLPFQHNPRHVALVMWAIGLMIWFDSAIVSYLLAM